ncbi:hypothetical protein SUGI_1023460 [Cryptomeria japonica]|nr:hypothetical protein SUGI_1023460 [Cryptomeria japonica]
MGERRRPHAVLFPFPAQGHINPMMQLANMLVEQGFITSFVNTDYNYSRIAQANKHIGCNDFVCGEVSIRWVVVPDGLPPSDKRTDVSTLCHLAETVIVSFIDKLIGEMEEQDPEQAICLVMDGMLSTALDAAKCHRVPMASLWTSLIATYALLYDLPNLVSSSLLPSNGVLKDFTMVKYLPSMPPFYSAHLPWVVGFDETQQEFLFRFNERYMERNRELKWVLFNSFYHLEAPIIDDLIAQGASSVVYVSFGSLVIVKQRQLEEFALGLEATQKPFLWVLRSDLMDGSSALLPPGFMEATKDRAYFVSWCPQMKVLSHPFVACFITHCGWNFVMESIAFGVPMLCWPYFTYQFFNCVYVVDVWRIGLALNKNSDGITEKKEIEIEVKRVFENDEMKARVLKLSEEAKDAVKSE